MIIRHKTASKLCKVMNTMSTEEEVIMMSSFGVLIDFIYYHSESTSSSFFSFLFKMLFISLFMKLTHIQVFKRIERMHETRI